MIRLALAFTAAELLDFATYLRAPHLESNPLTAAQTPGENGAGKALVILLAWGLVWLAKAWRRRGARGLLELVLLAGTAFASFSVGTNVATTAIVYAAADQAPRSTPELMGFPAWSAAPGSVAPDPTAPPALSPGSSDATAVPPAASVDVPPGRTLRGIASWFDVGPGLYAAAGPALRRRLGPGWRRDRVRVCAGDRCVRVRLTDWCQCYRSQARERVIDLGADAFRQLAPLSRGLVRVSIEIP